MQKDETFRFRLSKSCSGENPPCFAEKHIFSFSNPAQAPPFQTPESNFCPINRTPQKQNTDTAVHNHHGKNIQNGSFSTTQHLR
jgi:hypothetical protein